MRRAVHPTIEKRPSAGRGVDILIGAHADVYEELGIKLTVKHESAAAAHIFKDLKLEKKLHPVRPLVEGRWE
jgi:hypothetical protein